MGKKGGGSTVVQAPSAQQTAAAQSAANKETAITQAQLNMIGQETPYGSLTYEQTGTSDQGTPQYKAITTLSPEQQALLDQEQAMSQQFQNIAQDKMGQVQTAMSPDFTYEGMPGAPTADSAARQQVIDALYGQYQSRLDPQYQQQQTALETQLANQGIAVGSDAYNQAMESFGRTRNDAYTSALNQAIAGGGAEQSRLFGLEANARERAIQEAAYLRGLPLQEAQALMGSAGGITMPTFTQTPQTGVAGTDVVGAQALQTQAMQSNAANAAGQQNALMGGLFGLGGSALGGWAGSNAGASTISGWFSDRRLKTNIKKVGKLDNGLNVYSYNYVWGGPAQIGVMAQEVEKVNPDAVGVNSGFKVVDYERAVQ